MKSSLKQSHFSNMPIILALIANDNGNGAYCPTWRERIAMNLIHDTI